MPVRVETFSRIEDAERALSANQAARFFGGGTILMRAVNEGDQSFDTLVRLTDPAFAEIRPEGVRITLGAGVTMNQVMASPDLAFLAPVARSVGGPAVRSTASVGGNLYAAAPYGDFATALLALDATLTFAGQAGAPMPIDAFMRERDRHANRIVSAVSIERPRETAAFRWLKVSRVKPKGLAVLSIAAHLPRSGGAIRVAYGNMGPTPVRVAAVEQALQGAQLTEQGIGPALAAATQGLSPPSDSLASDWYRREVAPVHLKRLLLGQTG
ncbi:MAG: FAD binding domain-containing protein [Pseudomonadota bacterium]